MYPRLALSERARRMRSIVQPSAQGDLVQCNQALDVCSCIGSRSVLSLSSSVERTLRASTSAMAVETFDGQLTRANVQLAVRSGVLTEAESSRYWQARRRYRTLSDSNSTKTIEKVTQEFEEAKKRVLECMNTSSSDLLERERGEKRRLAAEVESLKRRLADVCERA